MLGNGFYNALDDTGAKLTERQGSLCQIYVTYTDGTEDIIVIDQSWKAAKSPIIMDLIYQGEHYDARLEQPGWNAPGFDDSEWENAASEESPKVS
ncbi:MAG: alpha-L-rhamnosidase N-terminal domain-containing protein [Sphingobacterium sp.]|nr:alpha-L-rhamnosidase N-terminal domain-containing protein [Sphingobacterium sp.]